MRAVGNRALLWLRQHFERCRLWGQTTKQTGDNTKSKLSRSLACRAFSFFVESDISMHTTAAAAVVAAAAAKRRCRRLLLPLLLLLMRWPTDRRLDLIARNSRLRVTRTRARVSNLRRQSATISSRLLPNIACYQRASASVSERQRT